MTSALRRFDTLKSYNALKESGISDGQAITLVEMIKEATDSSIEHLATKEDLAHVKFELKEDIANVKAELKEDISNLKGEFANLKGDFANLKGDFANFRAELKEDNALLRAEFKEEVRALKEDNARSDGKLDILTKIVFGFCFVVVINMVFFWLHH